MTDTPKILAQWCPASGALTTGYTVPAGTNTVISSIAVCNSCSAPNSFRLATAKGGYVDCRRQYPYWDVDIPAKDSFIATIGIALEATDEVRGLTSASGCVCFNLYGVEVT